MTKKSFPENVCIAPFAYMTFDPATNVSPCPALGGSVWNFKGQPLQEIWNNKELTDFRQHMLENKKHKVCHRCWGEEAVGMKSERVGKWNPSLDPSGTNTVILDSGKTAADVMDPSHYKKGPIQLVIKVGNVCNLRCRSCNSADSITLAVEGKYYEEQYGLKDNFYLKETKTKTFTDEQIDEIVQFCENVVRIEFYGGEPLVDKQVPKFLQKLVDLGYSRKINLNISTNVTQRLDDEFIEILSKFGHVNISLSIDGWGEHFSYLRHPANWDEVKENIDWFIQLRESNRIKLSLLVSTTVTIMNVYDLPDLLDKLENIGLTAFLILAWYPFYYSIKNIPLPIAEEISKKLSAANRENLQPIIQALNNEYREEYWEKFKSWTAMVDKYRKESFADTFDEYTNMIRNHEVDFLK
jgi:radical SAM protein with 4Fe4S-binding SPASM domain